MGNIKQVSVKKNGRMVGVRTPHSGMTYRFFTTLRSLKVHDTVLLSAKGEEVLGLVMFLSEEGSRESFLGQLFGGGFDVNDAKETIIQALSENERKFFAGRAELEQKARSVCREKIREMNLPMRLAMVRYLSKGSKAVFYFTAENRVDFRDLVRILSIQLKVRVEMRHVGVRDETKIVGGLGLCGNEFCCSQHLHKFHPVSVRMAKNQELSLNPEGISGSCGRLLCCLEYENDTYRVLRDGLPKIKTRVKTADGREGVVCAVYPLLESVSVQFGDGNHASIAKCDLCVCGAAPVVGAEDNGQGCEQESSDSNSDEVQTRPGLRKRPKEAVTSSREGGPDHRFGHEKRLPSRDEQTGTANKAVATAVRDDQSGIVGKVGSSAVVIPDGVIATSVPERTAVVDQVAVDRPSPAVPGSARRRRFRQKSGAQGAAVPSVATGPSVVRELVVHGTAKVLSTPPIVPPSTPVSSTTVERTPHFAATTAVGHKAGRPRRRRRTAVVIPGTPGSAS